MKTTLLTLLLIIQQISFGQCISGDCNNGFGKMLYDDGGIYEGNFNQGQWHGYGEIKWASGSTYKGNFLYGKKHGLGIYQYFFGDVFNGEYINGNMYKGKYSYRSGDIFDGEFLNGLKQKGTYYFASGDKYIGNYSNNLETGIGTYYWSDGSKYEGNFQNGKFNGKGKKTLSNGEYIEGDWKDDNLINNQNTISQNSDLMIWKHSKGSFEQKNYFANNAHIWEEDNGKFSFEEISNAENIVVLKDRNRLNFYIKLTPSSCYFKTGENNWGILYYGSWTNITSNKLSKNDTLNNNIILHGYNVGNWQLIDNSSSILCGICNKNCSVKRSSIELEKEKIEKNEKLLKDLYKDHFNALLNYYRNKPNPSNYVFNNYLESHSNANTINLYKCDYTYYNIFYNPFFVGYYCSEAHYNTAKKSFDAKAKSNLNTNTASKTTTQTNSNNTPNSSNNTANKCNSCSGTGLCNYCNSLFEFKTLNSKVSPAGTVYCTGWDISKEKKLGWVKCTSCTGHGITMWETASGPGSKNCSFSQCSSGWVKCSTCNTSGNCHSCGGSGMQK